MVNDENLEPYIDYYFEISDYIGEVRILEEDKCDKLLWVDMDDLSEPFINYVGDFLENKMIDVYDNYEMGAYIKKKNNFL